MSVSGDTVTTIVSCIAIACLLVLALVIVKFFNERWTSSIADRLKLQLSRRRDIGDSFRDENGYSYDYCIVFKVYDENEGITSFQRKFNMQYILDRLDSGGLQTRLFYDTKCRKVFCKIRAPFPRIAKEADIINLKLHLDPVALEEVCKKGREGLWDPLKIPKESDLTKLSPYDFIYVSYEFDPNTNSSSEYLKNLYIRYPNLTPEQLIEIAEHSSSSVINFLTTPLDDLRKFVSSGSNLLIHKDTLTNEKERLLNNQDDLNLSNSYKESQIFRSVDRIKVIHHILTSTSSGCCGLNLDKLDHLNCIVTHGPLHDPVQSSKLELSWIQLLKWPWQLPIIELKDYFGEKIGLYFYWLIFYTTFLIPASVIGIIAWIVIATDGNSANSPITPYFAGFISVWASLYLEFWYLAEKRLALEWGTIGFEEDEVLRPDFEGIDVLSAVTGKPTKYFPVIDKVKKSLKSQVIVCAVSLIIIGIMLVIIVVISEIMEAIGEDMGNNKSGAFAGVVINGFEITPVVTALCFAFFIEFTNNSCSDFVISLVEKENHRTETEFEDSLIGKNFLLQFFNSMSFLFYIAFVKPFLATSGTRLRGCQDNNCMQELQISLGTVFLTRLILGNIIEIFFPFIKLFWKRKKIQNEFSATKKKLELISSTSYVDENTVELKDINTDKNKKSNIAKEIVGKTAEELKYKISDIEEQFLMEHYDVFIGIFGDYSEMIIQFAYTTLFVCAFPLAFPLAFLNNFVEIRIDGLKLLSLHRRPLPRGAEDIGTWAVILEIIVFLSFYTNAALIVFTGVDLTQDGDEVTVHTHQLSDGSFTDDIVSSGDDDGVISIKNYFWYHRLWMFIMIGTGLLSIRLLLYLFFNGVPNDVEIQIKRQEFILGKVVENREDEDEEDTNTFIKTSYVIPNYLVIKTDVDPM